MHNNIEITMFSVLFCILTIVTIITIINYYNHSNNQFSTFSILAQSDNKEDKDNNEENEIYKEDKKKKTTEINKQDTSIIFYNLQNYLSSYTDFYINRTFIYIKEPPKCTLWVRLPSPSN